MTKLTRRSAFAGAAFGGVLLAIPAAACSPAPGYRVPTNLELTTQADAILIGRVAGEVIGESPLNQAITIQPVQAIKGLLPAQPFPIAGMALDPGARPSDPVALGEPHPDALGGACIRRTFAPGATVLLMLDRRDGEWVPAGGPFSRWAEDVSAAANADAPWTQVVRFYSQLADLPVERRTALLEAERDAFAARSDDPAAQAIAADLARQLAGPNAPLRPAPEAIPEAIDAGPAGNPVEQAIDAMGAAREAEEAF